MTDPPFRQNCAIQMGKSAGLNLNHQVSLVHVLSGTNSGEEQVVVTVNLLEKEGEC